MPRRSSVVLLCSVSVRILVMAALASAVMAGDVSAQAELRYSTYLGGPLEDSPRGAVGADGAVYTATAEGAGGGIRTNVRVMKFAAVSHAVVYSVLIGGSQSDLVESIAVAADGAVWVTGHTNSPDFPVMNPIQTYSGIRVAFLFRLSPAGVLTFSTIFAPGGGGGLLGPGSQGQTVIADIDGSAVWSGRVCTDNLLTTPGVFQPSRAGHCDGFIARVSATGALVAATYLGGTSVEGPPVLALGPDRDIYLGGVSASVDLPTSAGAFQATPGSRSCSNFVLTCDDGYVGRFSPDLRERRYLTYLRETDPLDAGLDHIEAVTAIAVGPTGDAYVSGGTRSGNLFPTTAGAYRTTCFICNADNRSDVFVTRLNAAGTSLVYSTFLGGPATAPNGNSFSGAIAVDGGGRALVGGSMRDSDFPVLNGSQVGTAFLSRFNAQGTALEYSTHFGGNGIDRVLSLALGPDATVWIAGTTTSTDFPTTADALQPAPGGMTDGFVAGLSLPSVHMSMDLPAAGQVTAPFDIGGWAIDRGAGSDSGIDAIHVYAYPNYGSGASPIFLGGAPLGFARPDIAAIFGPQFANAGWLMRINSLAPGPYLLVAFAHSRLTASFDAVVTRAVTVVVDSRPLLFIDSPAPGAVVPVGMRVFVGGWAIDQGASSGTGIDAIHVWIYPNSGSGTPFFAGVPVYGVSRPDVGAILGSRFTPSGYELDVNGLSPGSYLIAVFAHSTVTNSFVVLQTRAVTISQ